MWFILLIALVAIVGLASLLMDTRRRVNALEIALEIKKYKSATPVQNTAKLIQSDTPDITAEAVQPLSPTAETAVPIQRARVVYSPQKQPLKSAPNRASLDDIAPEKTQQKRSAKLSLPRISFEELFGQRLPIWAGGATLAVAGLLLVKYSIDSGLLAPVVRVILGAFFGAGLICGAEWALRKEGKVQDARVRQALCGAGIATLYAAALSATNLYHLIGPAAGFGLLAVITALAMALSIRFGAPSAVLGLVGGLAAPALVNAGAPNVPLLSSYLALAIGGLCALSRQQKWMWLGVSALIGGAGWGAVLILSGGLDLAASLSVGLLVLGMGIALPLFAFEGSRSIMLRGIAALVAAAQIAALVATGGFEMLHWGLYGLLSIALCWLSWNNAKLSKLPGLGLAVGLLLAAVWPDPVQSEYIPVMLAMTAIYGGYALMRLWKPDSSIVESSQLAALSLGGFSISLLHYWAPYGSQSNGLAMLALAVSALPMAGATLGWTKPERNDDARFASLVLSTSILISAAVLLALASWFWPVAIAALAVLLLALAVKAHDRLVDAGGLAFSALSVGVLLLTDMNQYELLKLTGDTYSAISAQSLLRWAAVVLATAAFAWRSVHAAWHKTIIIGAALLAYGFSAQFVPASWLALAASAGLWLVIEANRRVPSAKWLPAVLTYLSICALWALAPLGIWAYLALSALSGQPMLAADLPDAAETLRQLALPAAVIGMAIWRGWHTMPDMPRRAATGLAAAMALVSVHILYKLAFHQLLFSNFETSGLAERTLWQALLMAAGYIIWQSLPNAKETSAKAGALLVGAGLAHNILFSMLLHNPLIAEQAVGAWPLFNLLIPSFGLCMLGTWLIQLMLPQWHAKLPRAADITRMIIIALFAFTNLRQLAAGSVIFGAPIEALENIGWSVMTIALGIGYMLWGIKQRLPDWRTASLLLMLCAVVKVFLMDAAGLEGLLRIASFLALGFSLIGIGWLFNRFQKIGESQP